MMLSSFRANGYICDLDGYTVDEFLKLKPPIGTLLFSAVNGTYSHLVRKIAGQKWSHVALYVGNEECIDAFNPKVQKHKVHDFIIRADKFSALIPVKLLTAKDQNILCAEAHSFIGKKYEWQLNYFDKKKVNCTELIYHVYDSIGRKFQLEHLLGEAFISPDGLYNNPDFKIIFTAGGK